MKLTELHEEVLKESFNMGIGKAAAIISEMVGREVTLSVPTLKIVNLKELIKTVRETGGENITGIYQECSAPLKGTALLIYSHESSLELIGLLLDSESKAEQLGEVEAEALRDFGNITLSTCLEELGNVLEGNIETGFPQIITGDAKDVLTLGGAISEESLGLSLGMTFAIAGSKSVGSINLTLESIDNKELMQKLDIYCKKLFGDDQ